MLSFLAVTVICSSLMAPLPETDALFHEEVYNALEINLEDVGYVGGQLTVKCSRVHEYGIFRLMVN